MCGINVVGGGGGGGGDKSSEFSIQLARDLTANFSPKKSTVIKILKITAGKQRARRSDSG